MKRATQKLAEYLEAENEKTRRWEQKDAMEKFERKHGKRPDPHNWHPRKEPRR